MPDEDLDDSLDARCCQEHCTGPEDEGMYADLHCEQHCLLLKEDVDA